MLDVRHISRTYYGAGDPVLAVHDASLQVSAGEFVSITGHSGSGKSTLLAMIGGILAPDSGSVVFQGRDIWSLADDERSRFRGRELSFVFQFPCLIPSLTAEENVLVPTVFGANADVADAEQLLEWVGLQDKLKRYPAELSGGEQQRVAVARAFVNSPLLVLADEPTGNVDEHTERSLMESFLRYVEMRKASIIMVTHDRELAARASKRLTVSRGTLSRVA